MTENTFTLSYGVSGSERKRLVKAIAEYRNSFSEYTGAPHFTYVVDEITIDKNGILTFAETPDRDEIRSLTAFLKEAGFYLDGEGVIEAQEETKPVVMEESAPMEETPQEDDILTVEVPLEGFTEVAIENLRKMVDGRASLLKKSIGTDDLSIVVTDDKICFPWFKNPDPFNVPSYTKLIHAICKSAKEAKHVSIKDHDVSSEKYAFRVWLMRLGFIGDEFKVDRAVLMRNLTGTAAFMNPENAQRFNEKMREKRRAEKAAAKSATEAEA